MFSLGGLESKSEDGGGKRDAGLMVATEQADIEHSWAGRPEHVALRNRQNRKQPTQTLH